MVSPQYLVPPHILALRPYEPGLSAEEVKERFGVERAVKLASNENPLGVSPLAIKNVQRAVADMFRYPDGGVALRRKLAECFNLKIDNVIAGAGSEGIMADIVRAFLCDDDEVLTTEAAFSGFQVLARSRGVAYRTVPYRDWHYDLAAMSHAITDRTKLIYLANPNNPTGTFFTRQEFENFHKRVPERVLIILDEAYFEFAMREPSYPDSMQYRFDNVMTLRTFSKIHGLAGARVGYGFAHQDLISVLLKIKLPFEPSGIGEAAALGALEDREFMEKSIETTTRGLTFLRRSFQELGFTVVSSAANFIMVVLETEDLAKQVFESLLRQGVIVRPLKATGLPNCIRVSAGTKDENERCVNALQRVSAELEINIHAASH
ncbi:MAG: histidinol-phosphate transaminase [Bryobacteraceae bacterium]